MQHALMHGRARATRYTIIMIIPLSPPGHVFAFSLMKKYLAGPRPHAPCHYAHAIVRLRAQLHIFTASQSCYSMCRCFPAAVPSPFTAQRQDIYEIYTRIAIEVQSSPCRSPAAVRCLCTRDAGACYLLVPVACARMDVSAPTTAGGRQCGE